LYIFFRLYFVSLVIYSSPDFSHIIPLLDASTHALYTELLLLAHLILWRQ